MQAGDAPLSGCFGLQLGDYDFVETGCFFDSCKVNLERESAELDSKSILDQHVNRFEGIGPVYLFVVSLPNSAAIALMGWIFVVSLMFVATSKNSL